MSNKPSSPKHSFGKRIPSSLCQDPYVSVLPTFRTPSQPSFKLKKDIPIPEF
jgi:hypothetical protein